MAERKFQLKFEKSSYDMSSIVFSCVFSMLSLVRILISDLVVANLIMHSLSSMILVYLAAPFIH